MRDKLDMKISCKWLAAMVSAVFCHYIKLNYVSCSGPRVPIARLAAAQAKLLEDQYKEPV